MFFKMLLANTANAELSALTSAIIMLCLATMVKLFRSMLMRLSSKIVRFYFI